jgi:uncharacterized membrane protein YbhN (UPF0104 family)
MHVGDTKRFLSLLKKAEPVWLVLAIGLQIATYLSVGMIWNQVTRASKYYVPLGALARLSVEKLSVDQFLPALGMSGKFDRISGFEAAQTTTLAGIGSYPHQYSGTLYSLCMVTAAALLGLYFFYHVTALILSLAGIFVIILVVVP